MSKPKVEAEFKAAADGSYLMVFQAGPCKIEVNWPSEDTDSADIIYTMAENLPDYMQYMMEEATKNLLEKPQDLLG